MSLDDQVVSFEELRVVQDQEAMILMQQAVVLVKLRGGVAPKLAVMRPAGCAAWAGRV